MKNWLYALCASLTVNLGIMLINYFSYADSNYLKLAYRSHGGEITVEFSPGLIVSHIYAMTADGTNSHNLRFAPVLLLVGVAVGTGLFYLVIKLVGTVLKH